MLPPASRSSPLRTLPTALVRIAAIVMVISVAACASRARAPIEERSPRPPAPPVGAPVPVPEPPAPGEPEARQQTYIVKRGDTLYAIALDLGLDYRELAAWNNLENINRIFVGQVLRVAPPGDGAPAGAAGVQTMPLRSAPPVQSGDTTATAAAPAAASGGRNTETYKTQPKAVKEPYSEQALREIQRAAAAPVTVAPAPPEVAPPPVVAAIEPKAAPKPANVAPDDNAKLDWGWPAKGRVVAGFSEATSLKGIDIAGSAGQPITASAGGKVVYAGSGLRGYGKLIIIKHNDAYLSAYAHNRDILVKEGQQVVKGQKIAEMGNTDADQVKLHFEIRRQGKPVDPLRYLPPA
jgi:lipoprotein NlpD